MLSLPVHRLSLHALPSATRERLHPKIRHGRIRTVEQLLAELEPIHLQCLEPALAALVEALSGPTPPEVEDLLDGMVADLLRSVGMEGASAGVSWSTPRQVLCRIHPRITETDVRQVSEALRIRSERRSEALLLEEQREPARTSTPVRELVPLWSELRAARAELRQTIVPEEEHGALTRGVIEPEPPAIRVTTADRSIWVRCLLPEAGGRIRLDGSAERRWALGAIDRILDWIADPTSEIHLGLVALLGRPAWEKELQRLDRLLEGSGAEPLAVGWRLVEDGGGISFRPVACAPKKRGGWTPRNLGWSELSGPLEPVDRQVAGLLRRWKEVPPEIAALAAEALIGHPRVFGPGADGPIRVRRAELSLGFRREEGGVRPELAVDGRPIRSEELSGRLGEEGADSWLRRVPGELQVIAIHPRLTGALIGWLGRAPLVAEEGLGPLLARIPSLSPLIPIRLDPGLQGRSIAPDHRPVLRLSWDGATLVLEARVRPLPELPSVLPGEGPPELVTVRGGEPCSVRRDLEGERAWVGQAIRSLGLTEERPDWRWAVDERERAIALMLAVADAGGAFRTEWEGPSPSIGRIEPAALKLRVSSGQDWLEIGGGLRLEQDTVDLSQVLEALREGRSYLQIRPDAFLRIADRLRGPLRAVAAAEDRGRISPLHAPILEALADAGAEIEGSRELRASVDRIRAAASHRAELPRGLEGVLRDYQASGFRWLARLGTWAPGAVLADDMGLGKTVQAVALLCHRAEAGPALVVCPLSVLAGWEAELARFAPELEVSAYRGARRARALERRGPGTVVLVSWDLLARDAILAEIGWGTVVLDEAQAIKNPRTARSRAACALRAGFVVALSGTPVENRSEELWSLFRRIAPGLLGGEDRFRERLAGPIDRAEPGARDALARLVRPFVLRRTKAEVAPELPSRTEIVVRVPLSPDERALYETARREALARTEEGGEPIGRFEVLRWLTRLRQLACNPRLVDPGSPIGSSKLDQLRQRIGELREAGHQALVFSQFVGHLELAREALAADGVRVRWLTGEVDEARRRREVEAFQAGDGDVFLISLGAGGTGLTLTAAAYVFHLDPWWNPAREDQASDRAHRIGQTRPVTIYRLVAEGTIEEQILSLHERKRDLADALLSGADGAAHVGTEELLALLSGVVPDPDGDPSDDPDAPPSSR